MRPRFNHAPISFLLGPLPLLLPFKGNLRAAHRSSSLISLCRCTGPVAAGGTNPLHQPTMIVKSPMMHFPRLQKMLSCIQKKVKLGAFKRLWGGGSSLCSVLSLTLVPDRICFRLFHRRHCYGLQGIQSSFYLLCINCIPEPASSERRNVQFPRIVVLETKMFGLTRGSENSAQSTLPRYCWTHVYVTKKNQHDHSPYHEQLGVVPIFVLSFGCINSKRKGEFKKASQR